MKKIFLIITGLLLATSSVFASPTGKVDFETMSKSDSQVLFGSNNGVNAVVIDYER